MSTLKKLQLNHPLSYNVLRGIKILKNGTVYSEYLHQALDFTPREE